MAWRTRRSRATCIRSTQRPTRVVRRIRTCSGTCRISSTPPTFEATGRRSFIASSTTSRCRLALPAPTDMLDAAEFTGGDHRLNPPFNQLSRFREPGKINLNTVFDPRVWDALTDGAFGLSNNPALPAFGTTSIRRGKAMTARWRESTSTIRRCSRIRSARRGRILSCRKFRGPRMEAFRTERYAGCSRPDRIDGVTRRECDAIATTAMEQ